MNNEERILALLEQHSEMLAKINSRLDKTDSRLDKMDFRLDKMDSRLDIVESRLGKIDARLDRMEEYAETTRDGVNALRRPAAKLTVCRFPRLASSNGNNPIIKATMIA